VEETISEELVSIQTSFKELTGAEVSYCASVSVMYESCCCRPLRSRLKRLEDVHKSHKLGGFSPDTRRLKHV